MECRRWLCLLAAALLNVAAGADWERNGLTPDIEIAQGWDEFAADAEDEALRAALIWLQQ